LSPSPAALPKITPAALSAKNRALSAIARHGAALRKPFRATDLFHGNASASKQI
jgi:hypothetical protein